MQGLRLCVQGSLLLITCGFVMGAKTGSTASGSFALLAFNCRILMLGNSYLGDICCEMQ